MQMGSPSGEPSVISKNQTGPPVSTEKATEVAPVQQAQPATDLPLAVDPRKAKTKSPKKKTSSKPVVTPQSKIEVVDPSDELVDNSPKEVDATKREKSSLTASHIAVETNTSSKKYDFHYHFDDGKLVLHGHFDNSLYDILEIRGYQHA